AAAPPVTAAEPKIDVLLAVVLARAAPVAPVGPVAPDAADGRESADERASPVAPLLVDDARPEVAPVEPVAADGVTPTVEAPPLPPAPLAVATLAPPTPD